MPTGYTDKIKDGISFSEFAMQCARAFSALIMMRDEPMDAEIRKFKPSDYPSKELARARRDLAAFEAMTEDEKDAMAVKEYQQAVASNNKSIKGMMILKEKYDAMLAKVHAWNPPTPDHQELKSFMVKQIQESIRFDCDVDYYRRNAPSKPVLSRWIGDKYASLHRDVEYHSEELKKEVERTNGRNKWVEKLRESLKDVA